MTTHEANESALIGIMSALQCDTPEDALRRVRELAAQAQLQEEMPRPLLMVDTAGRITIRNDVTIRGLAQIIDALQNMRVAGAA